MHRKIVVTTFLGLSLLLPGCGSSADKAECSTLVEGLCGPKVAATATPQPTKPSPVHGPYYESNRASQKCLKLVVARQRNRCLNQVEKRFNVATTDQAQKQPGSSRAYKRIDNMTDCAALQEQFDIAEKTSQRPGGPKSSTWSEIGQSFMKTADERMDEVGCYG